MFGWIILGIVVVVIGYGIMAYNKDRKSVV